MYSKRMQVHINNSFCNKMYSLLSTLYMFVLQRALWSDMFTGRLKNEIPQALVCFATVYTEFVGHVQWRAFNRRTICPTGYNILRIPAISKTYQGGLLFSDFSTMYSRYP